MVDKGNYPNLAASFRLVKYYNLPIYIYISQLYTLIIVYMFPKSWDDDPI